LEKEQIKLLFVDVPTSPSPHSVEVPQNEIQNRERNETTSSRPEKPEDVCRYDIPVRDLEKWEQQESEMVVVVEGGGVAMQQQWDLAAQKEELGQPAVGEGHQQDLAEVVDVGDPRKPPRFYQPRNPRSPTSTVFDCVGYAPSCLLDANPYRIV
jgi:hypothetical protein